MSVARIADWPLPAACDKHCRAHEEAGYRRALDELAPTVVTTGPLAIDLGAGGATLDGRPLRLSPREWEVLAYLARPAGRWRSAREIALAIWDDPSTHLTCINVNRLRAKLGPAAGLLVTAPGTGSGYVLRTGPDDPWELPPIVRRRPIGRWSIAWEACRMCGRTDRRHAGRGYCQPCRRRLERRGRLP